MIERDIPGLPAGHKARSDGSVWFEDARLEGRMNTLGYLVVTIDGRQYHYAELIRRAFSPVLSRVKTVPADVKAEIHRLAKDHSCADIARILSMPYTVVWRIANGR